LHQTSQIETAIIGSADIGIAPIVAAEAGFADTAVALAVVAR